MAGTTWCLGQYRSRLGSFHKRLLWIQAGTASTWPPPRRAAGSCGSSPEPRAGVADFSRQDSDLRLGSTEMTTSRAAPFIPLVLASSFAAVLLACSKDTITAPPEKPSMAIWGGKPCGTNPNPALGGENQSGQVGQPLAKPLIVQVLDVAAGTRNGQILNFVVTSGGGTLFASVVATANPSSGPAAGCNGIGQNSWTLGPTAGPQTVAARVVDPINGATLTEATFHATATAGPAAVLKGSGGDQQTATAGTPVAIPPAVLVSDQLGNPLSGIPVTFSVKTGLGSITGPATVSTSTNGIAAVGGWTLGNTTGTNTLQAASSQFTATPVTFTAFGTTGSAAQVRVLSGNNQSQSACVGAPLPNKPTVQVLDANGNGVPTVAVTFTITGGGGSIDGVGSVTTLTSTGTASLLPGSAAVSWTLGSAPGTNTLQGTAVGLSGSPLAFNATGSGNCWTTKASMPTARENLVVAAIRGILYAVGGLDNGRASRPTLAPAE